MTPGVREKKKVRTQEAILKSALDLFTEKGYNETTIEEIADRAVVGVGTVYNYFGSKRGLLLAFSSLETESILANGTKFLKNPGSDPEKGLVELIWSYMQNMFRYDKRLLREFLVAAMADPENLGKGLAEDDYRMLGQVAELIEKYRSSGLINPKLPSDRASMVIYSSMLLIFHIYMAIETPNRELKKMLKDYIHIIFLDWKNEGGK